MDVLSCESFVSKTRGTSDACPGTRSPGPSLGAFTKTLFHARSRVPNALSRSSLLDGLTCLTAFAALLVAWRVLFPAAPLDVPFETRVIPDWEAQVAAGHHMGAQPALMTILEWGDYECPGCISYHSALSDLLAEFPGEVAVVYRHWPLDIHRFAYGAARAAECGADQGRFEAVHDLLFKTGSLDRRSLLAIGREAQIEDQATYEECVASEEPVARIESDIAAIQELEGWGTPSVAVNGVLFGRPPTPERLREMLQTIRRGSEG